MFSLHTFFRWYNLSSVFKIWTSAFLSSKSPILPFLLPCSLTIFNSSSIRLPSDFSHKQIKYAPLLLKKRQWQPNIYHIKFKIFNITYKLLHNLTHLCIIFKSSPENLPPSHHIKNPFYFSQTKPLDISWICYIFSLLLFLVLVIPYVTAFSPLSAWWDAHHLYLVFGIHSSLKSALLASGERVAIYIASTVAFTSYDVDWESLVIHETPWKWGLKPLTFESTKSSKVPIT